MCVRTWFKSTCNFKRIDANDPKSGDGQPKGRRFKLVSVTSVHLKWLTFKASIYKAGARQIFGYSQQNFIIHGYLESVVNCT